MLALDSEDKLWAWGAGTYGELGNADFNDSNVPKLVKTNESETIKDISCGGIVILAGHHSLYLTHDGAVYSFGYNPYGQLGLKHTENQCVP